MLSPSVLGRWMRVLGRQVEAVGASRIGGCRRRHRVWQAVRWQGCDVGRAAGSLAGIWGDIACGSGGVKRDGPLAQLKGRVP